MTAVADRADALWRAITYLSVAQLHVCGNPLTAQPLALLDLKPQASGHWGTVPGTAWALTHVGLVAAQRPDVNVVALLGAGHAGVAQRSLAWLTGDLGETDPRLGRDASGLSTLVASFPDIGELGSEVHPALPAGSYVGGWLGGALAFAQGLALEAPERVVVPVLGDGECETPTTAASWLAHAALSMARVLPIIHLNEHRMGGPSLLGAMSDEQVGAYLRGMGWQAVLAHVGNGDADDHLTSHQVIANGVDAVSRGERTVVVLRCIKGWSGPVGAHKTPLTDLRGDSHQRSALARWMSAYRSSELFDIGGQPVGALAAALDHVRFTKPVQCISLTPDAVNPQGRGFGTEVSTVLRTHAMAMDFKVFSPDELRSNRLGDIAQEPWVHEVLAEEVLLGWLAGWTASGRRGVLISYEAFAPLLLTGIVGQIKQRRLAGRELPSINLLLTSYGWHNVYTHGDPSLVTALLAIDDRAVHVFTPADTDRAAFALDDALRPSGCVNIIVAGKHSLPVHPRETLNEERSQGLAVWKHLSDPGDPDLTLVCSGDLAASAVTVAVGPLRDGLGIRIRVVNIHDLYALAREDLHRYVGHDAAVLIATLGHPAAIWGLLRGRLQCADVLGWREPPHPMPKDQLARHAGLDAAGITKAATTLIARRTGADAASH